MYNKFPIKISKSWQSQLQHKIDSFILYIIRQNFLKKFLSLCFKELLIKSYQTYKNGIYKLHYTYNIKIMGSTQSYQYQPKSHIVDQLHKILHLNNYKNKTLTNAMIHLHYAQKFSAIQNGYISRQMSPICPLITNGTWFSASIICPGIAITYDRCLFSGTSTLTVICNQVRIELQIEKMFGIGKGIAIIVLKQAFWKAGWVGISYIEDPRKIPETCKMIFHPQKKKIKEDDEESYIVQKIQKIKKEPQLINQKPPKIAGNKQLGSMLYIQNQKKPYIVGMQVTNEEIVLFQKQDFELIQAKVREYMKLNNNQQRILKQINIAQFQMYTMW